MIIGIGTIRLSAVWVHSLKEKRMVVKSIMDKVKRKYNVSIAEVDTQDVHQTITIGIACVSNSTSHAHSMIQNVVNYIENNTDAVLENVEIETV